MFQLTVGNYYDAFVDYISTLAVGGGNWTKVCNATSFELYDVFYHMKKLFVQPETMPLLQQERLRGIEIPFVRCQQGSCPCPASQTQLSLSIQNYNNIQNLEKIVLCFRRVSDTSNTALNDRLCLRNGSDYEIKVESGGYSTGTVVPYSDLLDCASNYNGIWKISLEWLNQSLITEKEIRYQPYAFRKARELASSVFNDNSEENFRMYEFEGLDRVGKRFCWMNANTNFFVAFDLRTLAGSELSGISLSRAPLNINIQFKTDKTTRKSDLQIDYYLFSGCNIHSTTQGSQLRD